MCPAEDPIAPPDASEARVILVVEDEVLVRLALAHHLRDCGFKVIEAANGAEAQGLLLAGLNADLVFSDITMPNMDGVALARWLAEAKPDTPVVLTSGLQDSLRAAEETCKGVRAFVSKPYDHAAVTAQLRAVLA